MVVPLPENDNPVNAPKRSANEILRDVVWRWCLEGELGIENESGALVGEVTERPRTGYRASLQGYSQDDLEAAWRSERAIGWLEQVLQRYAHSPLNEGLRRRVQDVLSFHEQQKSGLKTILIPHTENFERRFLLSQTQVTQELWESVMGSNPSHFKGANLPVENVSWEDTQEFVEKLNGMRDKLGVPFDYHFVLPFEAQWELACRAAPTNACPSCNQARGKEVINTTVLDARSEVRNSFETVYHRNSKGEVTGSTNIPTTKLVTVKTHLDEYRCKHCGHEWSKTYTTES